MYYTALSIKMHIVNQGKEIFYNHKLEIKNKIKVDEKYMNKKTHFTDINPLFTNYGPVQLSPLASIVSQPFKGVLGSSGKR